jgi:hypothetical protein
LNLRSFDDMAQNEAILQDILYQMGVTRSLQGCQIFIRNCWGRQQKKFENPCLNSKELGRKQTNFL